MRQLTQKLKDGSMNVLEVPCSQLLSNHVLVHSHYSLVSPGTEGSTVKTARKGFIGKAEERPQQVKQVFDTLKSQGPLQTYRAVMKKLDAYSPLGYSCVGKVIEVGSARHETHGIKTGDLVACGGLTASHAEIVSVPENLCVKLKDSADMKQAAYNTLGAIAMQGIRQADLRLGETCLVLGLGLLGQLTCLLLRASGIRVLGVDIDSRMVEIAKKNCADFALERDTPGIESKIHDFTGGLGCDAVIITAASSSLDPINFAGATARKRGTIVVVGAVPTGFDREPHFYKKELQVRMSCSYGPGRYDPLYEEKGIDYPPAYVRWTEKRNMQAFQELIYSGKIDVSYLTTHTFKLEDAPKAYDMMMDKSEPFIGILIEYDTIKEIVRDRVSLQRSEVRGKQQVGIGFIGAGSYAQSHLLPNIPKGGKVILKGVMTSSGTSSRSVGERFGFEFCTGDAEDILCNNEINTVFIATRHDTHANYVLGALKAGKHVFVEKPLCLTLVDLNEMIHSQSAMFSPQPAMPLLMVGYNRRFSPLAVRIKEHFGDGPMAMIYRVNAGAIPPDSWIQDPEVGGGRIIGEVCHFVDFLTFMNGSLPVSVYGTVMDDPRNLNDVLNVSLKYENGSIGTISYFANGYKNFSKERIEIYANGCTAILDDFRELTMYPRGRKKSKKLMSQDKGQRVEVSAFIDAVLHGKEAPISFDEIHSASLVTFRILESLRTGQVEKVFGTDLTDDTVDSGKAV